jgi:hypothetical protein
MPKFVVVVVNSYLLPNSMQQQQQQLFNQNLRPMGIFAALFVD